MQTRSNNYSVNLHVLLVGKWHNVYWTLKQHRNKNNCVILQCEKFAGCEAAIEYIIERMIELTINHWPLTIDCWPLTVDHWLLTTDYWLLTTDPWPLSIDTDCRPLLLLTADCWLLTTDRWLLTVDYWPLTTESWLMTVDTLTVDTWLLTTDRWLLTVDRSVTVNHWPVTVLTVGHWPLATDHLMTYDFFVAGRLRDALDMD